MLGIHRFEDHPDVIENAADRQMAHVRLFQSGKYSRQSQELLNEISAARVCLLDPEKKAAYDAGLREAVKPGATGEMSAFDFADLALPGRRRVRASRGARSKGPSMFWPVVLAGAVVAVVLFWFALWGGSPGGRVGSGRSDPFEPAQPASSATDVGAASSKPASQPPAPALPAALRKHISLTGSLFVVQILANRVP